MDVDLRFLNKFHRVADHREQRARAQLNEARDQHSKACQAVDRAVDAVNEAKQKFEEERANTLAAASKPRDPKWLLAQIAHNDHLAGSIDVSERTLRERRMDANRAEGMCDEAKGILREANVTVRKVDVWTDRVSTEKRIEQEVLAEAETEDVPTPRPLIEVMRLRRAKKKTS